MSRSRYFFMALFVIIIPSEISPSSPIFRKTSRAPNNSSAGSSPLKNRKFYLLANLYKLPDPKRERERASQRKKHPFWDIRKEKPSISPIYKAKIEPRATHGSRHLVSVTVSSRLSSELTSGKEKTRFSLERSRVWRLATNPRREARFIVSNTCWIRSMQHIHGAASKRLLRSEHRVASNV